MACAVHRNESARQGREVLETFQHIPGKGQRKLLFVADAVRPNTQRGFVPVCAACRSPLDPRQDVTHRCQAVRLEAGIEQHRPPVAEVLHRVGVHIHVRVLQAVKVSRVILTPLLFQNANILVRFALLGAPQEEIGFARTLDIRDNDFRRNRRLHDDPFPCSAVLSPWTCDTAMAAG
jgi:hypothetical protein